MNSVFFVSTVLVLLGGMAAALISRYRMCPPDKILVVYGAIGGERSSKCHAGGAAFVLPILQSFGYLDLRPISIDVPLRSALSSQNIRIDVPASFTIGISTEPGVMENAATRLLDLGPEEVRNLASEIILGQMRVAIASMTIEEINADREKLVLAISRGVDTELNKVGLKMINCNISDIKDASGYIEALGREAAARAINEANIKVAEETRKGEIGKAEAERDQAIAVAAARAEANTGENTAAIKIAESNAAREVKEAEFARLSSAAEKVQNALVLEESYLANARAEEARAKEQKSRLTAEVIVPAEVAKRQAEIGAEAEAQKTRLIAQGAADAQVIDKEAEARGIKAVLEAEAAGLFSKLKAEASGAQSMLEGRAQGFKELLSATGHDLESVSRLIVAERIVEISQTLSEAVGKVKMDKVVVMGGGSGSSSTGVSSLMQDLFKGALPLAEVAESLGFEIGKSSNPGKISTSAQLASAEKNAPTSQDLSA
jgi:flotillin